MKGLKRIAAVIAGTGLIGLAELAVAQTALAQLEDFPFPSADDRIDTSLTNPTNIATIDGQEFYVTQGSALARFRPNAADRLDLFPGSTGNSLNGVAVNFSSGNIYVADTGNNEVDIFDSSLNLDDSLLDDNLPGTGFFTNPSSVAVNSSSGNIYVADTGNNEVDIFDSNRNFVARLPGTGFFTDPSSFAVNSSSGNIYVADTGNNEVDIFDSNRNFVARLPGTGFFTNLTDVAVDESGNISVIDFDNRQVDLFDSSRNFVTSIGGFSNPIDLTVDESGRVYVLDTDNPNFSPLNTGIYQIETTPVPEPSSALGILAFGAMGAGYMLKRKLQKSNRHLPKSA